MTVEPLPHFTAPAAERWEAISPDSRKLLISDVWCGKCRRRVTIINFFGTVRDGSLLLVGRCAECQGDVARVIESGWESMADGMQITLSENNNEYSKRELSLHEYLADR